MLAVCQQRHWPLNNTCSVQPPVQQLIFGKVAELLRCQLKNLSGFTMTVVSDLSDATWANGVLYAQLASGRNVDMERIVRAMTHHPVMVAGDKEFDTELML